MMKLSHLLLTGALLSLAATGCSKKSDAQPTLQPRDYQVEYRVTSTTNPSADYIDYVNETGGNTNATTGTALPVTYSFKRNMKLYDNLTLSASLPSGPASSEITATILLDGKVVKQETGRGTQASAIAVYLIGQ